VPAAALAAGLTEDQVSLITEENRGYILKFKTVEWWEQLRERFESLGN
jgi:stage II sporulation protein R